MLADAWPLVFRNIKRATCNDSAVQPGDPRVVACAGVRRTWLYFQVYLAVGDVRDAQQGICYTAVQYELGLGSAIRENYGQGKDFDA